MGMLALTSFLPCLVFGTEGFWRACWVRVPTSRCLSISTSSGSSSWEVRGVSAGTGGTGSNMDWRDIEAVSALLLLLSPTMVCWLALPELRGSLALDVLGCPVSNILLKESTSIACFNDPAVLLGSVLRGEPTLAFCFSEGLFEEPVASCTACSQLIRGNWD